MSVLPPIAVKTVAMCCAWYAVLAITLQVTKVILVRFTYPFLISQVQFAISAVLSYTFIRSYRRVPGLEGAFPPGTVPADPDAHVWRPAILVNVLPLGLLQLLGKFFSLSATLMVPVATVASVKALSPLLIVAGYRVLYRVRFPPVTYALLMPLLAGVVMMILDTDNSDRTLFLSRLDSDQVRGLLLCVVSAVLMAGQQIYSKELVTWDAEVMTNPASLVLNTAASRPVTPIPRAEPLLAVADSGLSRLLLLPGSILKHFTQRTGRLPYSVSDLRLDEQNTLHQMVSPVEPEKTDEKAFERSNPYLVMAQDGRESTNPLAALTRTGSTKPDKLTVILYTLVVGSLFSLGGFLVHEAAQLVAAARDPSLFRGTLRGRQDLAVVVLLVFVNSMCHFCQSVISLLLLGSIPALSYSIASMLKRIVIIVVSILFAVEATTAPSPDKWFGRMSTQQVQGLLLIALGLYCYDRWGSRSLKHNRS